MNTKFWAGPIGFILVSAMLLGGAVGQSRPAGPPAGYKIDAQYTVTSPDGATTVEQYSKTNADGDFTWQFWARRADALTMLPPEQPDYPAGFRFTRDSRWLVRMQKTGAGEQSLYLYHLASEKFAPATAKPLSDLAWAYFNGLAVSRRIRKPDLHITADLVKGADDNYRWMGEHWPDSRYLVIALSGELSPTSRHGQLPALSGWRCRYDLQTGKFDVPADFAANNKKALASAPNK